MADTADRLNQWLRDAHAMEEQAEQMLNAQASRIAHYPELSARMERHLEETKSQRDRLEACLDRRGVSTSGVKDVAAKVMAFAQSAGGMPAGDEVVKGALASYTFENMEIASYRILVATAEAAGDTETARVCAEICREEEAMAAWLSDHLPEVTQTFLARDEAGMDEAKR